jgi:hypothetical protein
MGTKTSRAAGAIVKAVGVYQGARFGCAIHDDERFIAPDAENIVSNFEIGGTIKEFKGTIVRIHKRCRQPGRYGRLAGWIAMAYSQIHHWHQCRFGPHNSLWHWRP